MLLLLLGISSLGRGVAPSLALRDLVTSPYCWLAVAVYILLWSPERRRRDERRRWRALLAVAGSLLLAVMWFWEVFAGRFFPDTWYGVLGKLLLTFFASASFVDVVEWVTGRRVAAAAHLDDGGRVR